MYQLVQVNDDLYVLPKSALGIGCLSKTTEEIALVKFPLWEEWKQGRLRHLLSESRKLFPWNQPENEKFVLLEGIPRIVGCRAGDVISLVEQDSSGERPLSPWKKGQKCPVALTPNEIFALWEQTRIILRFQLIEKKVDKLGKRERDLVLSLAREGRDKELYQFVSQLTPADTVELRLFLI